MKQWRRRGGREGEASATQSAVRDVKKLMQKMINIA